MSDTACVRSSMKRRSPVIGCCVPGAAVGTALCPSCLETGASTLGTIRLLAPEVRKCMKFFTNERIGIGRIGSEDLSLYKQASKRARPAVSEGAWAAFFRHRCPVVARSRLWGSAEHVCSAPEVRRQPALLSRGRRRLRCRDSERYSRSLYPPKEAVRLAGCLFGDRSRLPWSGEGNASRTGVGPARCRPSNEIVSRAYWRVVICPPRRRTANRYSPDFLPVPAGNRRSPAGSIPSVQT